MKNKILIILGLILFLAAFLRFYNLSFVPPSASLDEASIGYNAYSILQTGKDEYGTSFPILLRAFDDYRPALYVYFVIPFIKFFGLNVLSVRLPSVILSTLTVLATYFLVKNLFRKNNQLKILSGEYIGLLTAFFLAISPWHIYISRLGHEVNLGLSFAIFAVLFFLKKRFYLSTAFFLISFISYQSEKIFIPLLLLAIFIIYRDKILPLGKKLAFILIISIIILIPFIRATLSPNALIRFKGTNIFEANKQRYINQALVLEKINKNDPIRKILYNRRVLTLQIFAEAYLSHFNPVWLFTNPASDRHKVPNIGLLYIWELPLVIIGLYSLASLKFSRKTKMLLLSWFLIAPLSSALTTDAPHALRSFVFLPTWQIFSSIGTLFLFNFLKSKKTKKLFLIFSFLLLIFTLLYFREEYFLVFPKTQSGSFQYALRDAVFYALKNKDNYKKIVFDKDENLFQSYMFFLFYSSYDPRAYQNYGGTVSGGYESDHKFDKFEFRRIDALEGKGSDILYIANYKEIPIPKNNIPLKIKTLKVFANLDDKKAIRAFEKFE